MAELKIGLEHSITYKVEEKDSALKVGSGLVDVFATPSLIALCEKTCSEMVKDYLQVGQVTVGSDVQIKHSAPSKIGATVKAKAQLIGIDGRKLYYRVVVIDGTNIVAIGSHTRFIVDKQRFMDKLK